MKTRETIKELAALIAANNETIKPEKAKELGENISLAARLITFEETGKGSFDRMIIEESKDFHVCSFDVDFKLGALVVQIPTSQVKAFLAEMKQETLLEVALLNMPNAVWQSVNNINEALVCEAKKAVIKANNILLSLGQKPFRQV